MDTHEFNGVAGSLVLPSGQIYKAFIPKPLPVKIEYDEELIQLISEASMKLGKLEGAGYLLRNPHLLLIRPYMQKEAVLSSKIEGTISSLSDVLLYEAKEEGGESERKKSDDIKEVRNYVSAMEQGIEEIETNNIDMKLLLSLHQTLLKNVRGATRDPGKLKQVQNWIGRRGCEITEATFVPAPPENVPELLENLFAYIKEDNGVSALVKMGMVHYQFEAIHPFRDGNGRIGRLLITLSLMKKRTLSLPLLYLSAYFERNKDTYYGSLLKVSQKADYTNWLKFFLKGVITQSDDCTKRIKKIMEYHDECRTKVKLATNSTNCLLVLDSLFVNPYITIPHSAKIIGKGYPSGKRAVETLEKLGIIEEITRQQRSKVYLARKIIRIIEG